MTVSDMADPKPMIQAHVVEQRDEGDGLTIQFTLSGAMETRFRRMMNDINESDGGITKALEQVFYIAFDAVGFIAMHKKRLY